MNRRQLLLFTVLALATGIGAGLAGHWFFMMRSATPGAADGRKVLYWTDPMVPGYRSDKPGKSPFMDMELVPVYENASAATSPDSAIDVVAIAPEIINRLGVRTETVALAVPTHRLVTDGYVFRDGATTRVLVDVFERDVDWIRRGVAARVETESLAGRRWSGRVEAVQPDVDIGARTLHVTIDVVDPERALRPNWLAHVTLEAPAGHARLLVPREAVIRTGTRTAVILTLGEGRFQPVNVTAGQDFDDRTEILAGLKNGQAVVVSGQFLIDSEANLRASFQRLSAIPASGPDTAPPASSGGNPTPEHRH